MKIEDLKYSKCLTCPNIQYFPTECELFDVKQYFRHFKHCFLFGYLNYLCTVWKFTESLQIIFIDQFGSAVGVFIWLSYSNSLYLEIQKVKTYMILKRIYSLSWTSFMYETVLKSHTFTLICEFKHRQKKTNKKISTCLKKFWELTVCRCKHKLFGKKCLSSNAYRHRRFTKTRVFDVNRICSLIDFFFHFKTD